MANIRITSVEAYKELVDCEGVEEAIIRDLISDDPALNGLVFEAWDNLTTYHESAQAIRDYLDKMEPNPQPEG